MSAVHQPALLDAEALHRAAPRTYPDHVDPAAFAIVSRRVWDDDAWPRMLFRNAIPDASFSGWVVTCGDDPEEYVRDWGDVGTTMSWDNDALEYVEAAPDPR